MWHGCDKELASKELERGGQGCGQNATMRGGVSARSMAARQARWTVIRKTCGKGINRCGGANVPQHKHCMITLKQR